MICSIKQWSQIGETLALICDFKHIQFFKVLKVEVVVEILPQELLEFLRKLRFGGEDLWQIWMGKLFMQFAWQPNLLYFKQIGFCGSTCLVFNDAKQVERSVSSGKFPFFSRVLRFLALILIVLGLYALIWYFLHLLLLRIFDLWIHKREIIDCVYALNLFVVLMLNRFRFDWELLWFAF